MYNPTIHHRRSIRLKGYDYSGPGLYFITICVQGRASLFGEITDGKMHLNEVGRMVEKWYLKLEEKFPDLRCGEYVVMPNHFHCIVENTGIAESGLDVAVGADPCVRPTPNSLTPTPNSPTTNIPTTNPPTLGVGGGLGEHMGSPQQGSPQQGSPVQRVVQWFKTMTTNEYIQKVKTHNWTRFEGKFWQRNYWEHIIRNEKAHQQIKNYIINNPYNWDRDVMNPSSQKQKADAVRPETDDGAARSKAY